MQPVVDGEKVEQLMRSQGLSISALASRINLTRQGVYNILRPGYQPFSKGFVSIAETLGVHPVSLLKDTTDTSSAIRELVKQSAAGEARAFEMLPAALVTAMREHAAMPHGLSRQACQLLAAAAEIAHTLNPQDALAHLAATFAPADTGAAVFFGADLMNAERIVQMTPEPMKQHLVFGAFQMNDFERHVK